MISLPKLRPLQRNLETHYVRLEGVFQVLSREGSTGYMRAAAAEMEGLIFLEDGEPMAAYLERGGTIVKGLDAMAGFLEGLAQSQGYMDIYTTDSTMLRVLLVRLECPALPLARLPARAEDLEPLASSLNLTGIMRGEGAQGDFEVYCSEGKVLGAFRPELDDWNADPRSLPPGLNHWTVMAAPADAVLRNVDLEGQRERVLQELRDRLERYVPGFGGRLLEVELAHLKVRAGDSSQLSRSTLERLADGLRVRARYLIGRARAAALYAEFRAPLNQVLDLEAR